MKIYKENSSNKFIKISEKDFNQIIYDIENLCDNLHSYCTSNEAYNSLLKGVDKEGR